MIICRPLRLFFFSVLCACLYGSVQNVLVASQSSLDKPLYLSADTVTYDEKTDTIDAVGDVEISQFIVPSAEKIPLFFETQKDKADEKIDNEVENAPQKSMDNDDLSGEKTKIILSKNRPLLQRYIKADHVIYNRKTQKITAIGNVMMIDEEENVLWSDFVDFDDTFDNGFIKSVRILLSDNEGRLTAKEGDRRTKNNPDSIQGKAPSRGDHQKLNDQDDNDSQSDPTKTRTTFRNVTYSPCQICEANPLPIWQIRSKRVVHDQENRVMIYRDVSLDVLGVPVLYSPYFYHPDPKVKRESGLLMPTYGQSSDLGAILKVPYYKILGPHNDMTVAPIITTKQGPILAAEYRHRFRKGHIHLDGSITQSHNLNRQVLRQTQNESVPPVTRFHILSKGRFEVTDHDLLTMEINRASDTTYLRRYNVVTNNQHFAQNKNLTSFAKWEKFLNNSYLGVKSYAFETDQPKATPYVLPMAEYLYQSDPGKWGETYGVEGHFLTLSRRLSGLNSTPKASTRGVVKGQFHVPYVTKSGQLIELDAQARGDLYYIHDYHATFQRDHSSYGAGRMMPTGSLTWRYPFVKMTRIGSYAGQYMIEPVAQVVASPSGLNPGKIPNEDCRFSELDDLNLFYMERMNGLDRTDSGQRVVYGFNTGLYGSNNHRVTLFLGQSYRLNKRGVDLIGDKRRGSDYVTRLQLVPLSWFKVHYRGRFDRDKFQNRFSEVAANLGYSKLAVNTSYVYVDKQETSLGESINQINWQVTSQITEKWSLGFTRSQNLSRQEKSARAYMASAIFQNDCFQMSLGFYHTQYRDRDFRPDSGVMLQFSFKNLGAFKPLSSGSFPSVSFRKLEY